MHYQNYFTLNNPVILNIKPGTNFSTTDNGIQYVAAKDTIFLNNYTTGGIRNKTNLTLNILCIYHIAFTRSSTSASGNYIYTKIKRHDNTTTTYTDYRYLGTTLFFPNTNTAYVTGCSAVSIHPNGGYIAIMTSVSSGTAQISTSGRVELYPMGLG